MEKPLSYYLFSSDRRRPDGIFSDHHPLGPPSFRRLLRDNHPFPLFPSLCPLFSVALW
jgi:hypothetical protein